LTLTVPLAFFLLQQAWWPALIVYLVAVLTDAVDGELARVRNDTSLLGARLDPSVDKVLHLVLYVTFLPASPILLTLLIVLDVLLFLVGLLTVVARKQPASIAGASIYGKWKFLVQTLSIVLLFSTRLAPHATISVALPSVLVLAIVFAVLSMVGYLQQLFGAWNRHPAETAP
jgi:CDP-diacylglycerol--glycerol-3-phosphate 3-phosphatidyltransferase